MTSVPHDPADFQRYHEPRRVVLHSVKPSMICQVCFELGYTRVAVLEAARQVESIDLCPAHLDELLDLLLAWKLKQGDDTSAQAEPKEPVS